MEKIRSTSVDSNTSGVNKAGSQEFDPESSTGRRIGLGLNI